MSKHSEEMNSAIRRGDAQRVRDLLKEQPELMAEAGWWLYDAAGQDRTAVVDAILSLGIDPNSPRYSADSSVPLCAAAKNRALKVANLLLEKGADVNAFGGDCGCPLEAAASSGSFEMVELLLKHGAKVNVGGGDYCTPLAAAATSGNLNIVELLLKHGAVPNIAYGTVEYGDPLRNALFQANAFGHTEVAALLRAHGAELPPVSDRNVAVSIMEHVQKHLGLANPILLGEIVPDDPAITILVVNLDWCVAVVTSGMSRRAMTTPSSGEGYRFAELVLYLPKDWPLSEQDLDNPNHNWPIGWLRRIARYPHQNKTWMGGVATIISNGEPPVPLGPNTRLCCFLAITEESEFGSLRMTDGNSVRFYTLFPLYAEERELEVENGVAFILRLFEKHGISRVIDVDRPNLGILPRQ